MSTRENIRLIARAPCVFAVTYHSKHLAHIHLKGYNSQKLVDFLLNLFCIKRVTIHLSACNFAIVYLYNEIQVKPIVCRYQNSSVSEHIKTRILLRFEIPAVGM